MITRQAQGAGKTDYIVVAIYNYARVPPEMLKRAEAQAAKIYENAGVTVDWRVIPAPAQDTEPPDAAGLAVHTMAYVNLVPDSWIPEARRRPGTLGCALGTQVYVFIDSLVQASARKRCPLHIGLGHVMAHEIGHVLLGPNSHTFNSIMAPEFDQGQFNQMKMRPLFFWPQHIKQMHELIRAQQPVRMAVLPASN